MNRQQEPVEIKGLAEKAGTPDHDSPGLNMALALGRVRTDKQLYAGTVPAAVVAKRRKDNRQASASRRINRGNR